MTTTVEQLRDIRQTESYARSMASSIGFRPNAEDERIIKAALGPGERTTDVIRRALRLLDREAWLAAAHADARRLADEDLDTEPDAW